MRFTIYQVSDKAPARFLFADLNEAEAAGGVRRTHYDEVFTGYYDEDDGEGDVEALEELYAVFNAPKKPDGYRGRSLSVSDVVKLEEADQAGLWYCDSIGWYELDGWEDAEP